MNEILVFFQQNGLWLTLIALAGVIILGVMKYCKLFKKLDEKARHACYLAISIGLSMIGSCIYIVCKDQFTFTYLITLTGAVFALNQAFYSIYDTTSLKDLLTRFVNWCFNHPDVIEDVANKLDDNLNK